jgi:hypothetical protein
MTKPMTDEQLEMLEEFPDENIQDCLREIRSLREELKTEKDATCDACAENHHEMKRLRKEKATLIRVMEETQGIAEGLSEGLDEALRELDEEKT